MKNKVFSLMAVVIFTTSLMSAAPINGILNIVSCTDVAVSVQNKLEKKVFLRLMPTKLLMQPTMHV